MNDSKDLTPSEITSATISIAVRKVKNKKINQFILAILAGAFIAFAAEGSNMAAFNLFANPETYGLGKAMAGLIFGTGLMLVVIAGGELFTGNNLILMGVFARKVKIEKMLLNWFFVYIGNFVGSLIIAFFMVESGLFSSGGDMLGAITLKIASYKVGLDFMPAFYLGIMCNWLVCLAVWMSYGSKNIIGKVFAIFFPIWLFVTSGFEHSVANMYYIVAGILGKTNEAWVAASGLSAEKLADLNWGSMLVNNLLPVTLGNLVGGGIFVGLLYWFVYNRNSQ